MSRESLLDLAMTAIVVLVAVAFALWMFAAYFHHPGTVWRDLEEDRTAHYMFGLDVALALRTLNPLAFLATLEQIRGWVPLNPLVLGTILAIGGIDHRLGILPGLIGWVMTIVLTWLIARKLFVDRRDGAVAGAVAAAFAIASPAFRAISADVMLEGLGAGLTALAMWLYLRACEAPHAYPRWRALAIALTLLFLQKQNYWLLTVVALVLAFVGTAPRDWLAWARDLAAGIDIRRAIRHGLKDPLLLAAAATGLAVVVITLHGPRPLEMFGRSLSAYPPRNPLTVAWALLFVRLAIAWYRHRAAFDARMGPIGRAMFYWQAVPIGVFLLLPQRLQFFLMYVSTANSFPDQHFDPWLGARRYALWLAEEYHVGLWSAALAVLLAAAALWRLHRLTPAARAPLMLLTVSAAAVVLHPNMNTRYLASWIFTLWIFSGAGAVIVLHRLTARLSLRAGALATGTAVLALVAGHLAAALSPGDALARRTASRMPSELELAAAYLPALDGIKTVGFLMSFGPHFFTTWTVRERCRCRATVDLPIFPVASVDGVRQAIEEWVSHTPAQRIVVIDAFDEHERLEFGWTRFQTVGMLQAMERQQRFARVATIWIPSYLAEVSIWSPRAAEGKP